MLGEKEGNPHPCLLSVQSDDGSDLCVSCLLLCHKSLSLSPKCMSRGDTTEHENLPGTILCPYMRDFSFFFLALRLLLWWWTSIDKSLSLSQRLTFSSLFREFSFSSVGLVFPSKSNWSRFLSDWRWKRERQREKKDSWSHFRCRLQREFQEKMKKFFSFSDCLTVAVSVKVLSYQPPSLIWVPKFAATSLSFVSLSHQAMSLEMKTGEREKRPGKLNSLYKKTVYVIKEVLHSFPFVY